MKDHDRSLEGELPGKVTGTRPLYPPLSRWYALAILSGAALVACGGEVAVDPPPGNRTATGLSGGASWRQVSTSPESIGPLAYDSARHKVWHFEVDQLLGGRLWDWDGTSWTLRATSGTPLLGNVPGPNGTFGAAMTYDSLRDKLVLVSGAVTWEWDGATWVNRVVPVSPSPRSFSVMAYDSERAKVVLFGGAGLFPVALDDTWEWDGTTWVERLVTGPVPPAGPSGLAYDAARHVTVLLSAGSTWEWDGTAWQQRSPGGSPPLAGSLTYDSTRGAVVLFGGTGGPKELFDWDGTSWTTQTSGAQPEGDVIAYDGARDELLLFGPGGGTSINTSEWDGASWTVRVRRPPPRQLHAMAYDESRHEVVMFGGSGSTSFNPFGDTWSWNGSIWEEKLAPGPGPYARPLMAFDSLRQKVVLFRGDTWEWDGTSWALRASSGASPSAGSAMTYDGARGTTLLFGGVANVGAAGDTWTWDGATWTQLSPLTRPAVTFGIAMAYDSAREKVVMVTPSSTPISSSVVAFSTWEWNGSDWTQLHPSLQPFGSTAPSMAYDVALRKVVLEGSWEWDGTNWTRDSSAVPPSRGGSAMAYDSVRGALVMFGGLDNLLQRPYGDTWEARSEGTPCQSSAQCTNSTCVDGVCCATTEPSCGTCRACNVPGTVGVCAPRTGSCDDGNACTIGDTCQAGQCVGSQPVSCVPQGECRATGTCDPATGACSNPPIPDGTPCSGGFCPTPPPDGGLCLGNMCVAGECHSDPCLGVSCPATDTCHRPGVCDPTSGACSTPVKPDGARCDDGDPRTRGDICRAGRCLGVRQPHLTPRPRHPRRFPW